MMSLDPRIGTRIGDYQIQQLLGRGGMSVVYLAEHIRLHRKVALKLLSPELAVDDTFRRRFESEWERLAQLDHPNIIPVFEAGEADGLLYIAMRYVQTTDLRALITNEGRLDPERAVDIVAQTASALDAAHKQDLVHRDVKPHNILVTIGGGTEEGSDHIYLADFGLTKHTQSVSGLTQTGHFMGTIDYVAPEQIAGKTVDGRTDEYALGCVLFECLTGHPPFRREEETAILFAHLQEPPPRATEHRPELPPALDDVLATAMAKDPNQRYATCMEFARAARRVVRLGSTPSSGVSWQTAEDGVAPAISGDLSSPGALAPAASGDVAVLEPTASADQLVVVAPAGAADPRIGTTVGRYLVKEVIGRGAMGVVYLAEHAKTGKQVALKLMSQHLFTDPQAMERFVQEARASDVLEHPNIVPIYDADEVDGVPYIAMKRVRGESLADALERDGALEPGRALDVLGQVATALDSAHERGIVHRDVKPHNILISSAEDPAGAGRAYLCDFGIIKDTASSRGLTSPAQTVGTRDYMAPEQFRGDAVDGRTDVYALGCVLFETLTGSTPFSSEGADVLMYAHLEKPPPSAHERRPDLPVEIDSVLHKALAKHKEDRFDKPTDLLSAAWTSLNGRAADLPQVSAAVATDQLVSSPSGMPVPPMPTTISAAPSVPTGVMAPTAPSPIDPTIAASTLEGITDDRTASGPGVAELAPPPAPVTPPAPLAPPGYGAPPAPASPPGRQGPAPAGRRRVFLVAAIVAGLALIAGVAVALSGGEDPAPQAVATSPAAPPTDAPTTPPSPEPPSAKRVEAPEAVRVAFEGPALVRIQWRVPSDGPAPVAFLVFRDGERVARVDDPVYRDTDVAPGERHVYRIIAVGEDGSESRPSENVVANVPAPEASGGEPSTGGGDTGTGGGDDTCTAEEFIAGECTP
jgi:serine/threonine protein kinase